MQKPSGSSDELQVTKEDSTFVKIENELEPLDDTHQQTSDKATALPTNYNDYHDKDPEKYGVHFSDDEEYYDPPEDDTELPDLYQYLNALEQGDTDLEANREPPSLFNRPEHVISYKNISHLKYEVEEETVHPYVNEFETEAKDDVLMIGNISLEEIQDEEKRLRDEHIAYQKQELEKQRLAKQELLKDEEVAKKRVAADLKEQRRQLARKIELAKQKERLQLDLLHKAFKRAENQLHTTLRRRKAEVKTMYGDLSLADGEYGGAKGRRWKLDWDKTPQPIQVKLKSLRGVKDKLPGGRYVLMISLYNRLGGHVMKWSKLKGQQWGGATLPTIHDGNFYNSEIKIDQSVFTVLPSKPSLRPGMVLVFELFLLRGAVMQTDRVVSWGAFPICDGSFEVIEGKYKTPFLRGEMDPQIDKHTKVEELMASDLDHWMCNLYFEVVKLPRYMAGQKEFEVELQFTSGMVNHPDRIDMDGEEYKDSENPVRGSIMSSDINSNHGGQVSSLSLKERVTSTDGIESTKSFRLNEGTSEDTNSLNLAKKAPNLAFDQMTKKMSPEFRKRPMTTIGSRYAKRERKVHVDESSCSSEDDDDEEMFALKKGSEEFKPVKGEPGLYYKRHLNNPVDIYAKKLCTMLPKSSILGKKRQKKKLTYAEQLEEHTASVKPPFSEKGRLAEKGWKRLNYVGRQMLAELGLSEWRSREFWGMLMMFVLTFFLRIYLHYGGQWLFLKAINIPINSFDFLPYTVKLNYQNSLLHTLEEIATVAMGPLTVFFVFVICVLLSWIMQMTLGMFPDLGSKFVMNIGIQAFMNPIFILIIDVILQNYNYNDLPSDMPLADFSKMYWHFYRTEGSGIGGIFVTIFLYFFIFFATASVLYMYFLRLHNNGRMLDIYWRLHSQQEDLFVPYDLEISIQELSYICKKAEQWRGEEGERRKVAVYEYVWEEDDTDFSIFDESGLSPSKQTKKEVTTHIAIHTVHLDGLRELYRHFLALPDGAVVEVFGEMSYVPGLDKEIKSAVNQGAKKVEDLMSSQLSFHKVRGRQTVFTRAGFQDDANLKNPGTASEGSRRNSSTSILSQASVNNSKKNM